MAATSLDLSKYFAHTAILATAGISVKGVTPEVTRCPFCNVEAFGIYQNPASSSSSKWLCCHACRWHGDTVEAYAKLRKYTSLQECVQSAIRDGIVQGPTEDLTESAIECYIADYPGWRKAREHAWSAVRDGLRDRLHPDVVKRVQHEHLWSGYDTDGYRRISRFIGAGLRKSLNETFRPLTSKGKDILPRDGFHTALVMGYQDLPGRYCAFEFLGDAGRVVHFAGERDSAKVEGGLAFLDVLKPLEGIVYATNEPRLALQMQRMRLSDSAEPLKLVVYNQATDTAWQAVNAQKTVFWTTSLSVELFKQARLAPGGQIAQRPTWTSLENVHEYVYKMPYPQILDAMANSAIPWIEALADWLTHRDTPDAKIREALEALALNERERKELHAACPKHRVHRIDRALGDQTAGRTTIVNSRRVFERGGAWLTPAAQNTEETVSDALVRLDYEIGAPRGGQVYWKGFVLLGNRKIPFTDPLPEIEKDPIGWLQRKATGAGLPTPSVAPRWKTSFVELIRRMNTPGFIKAAEQLGIADDGAVIMPRFTVRGGQTLDEGNWVLGPEVPAKTVLTPCRRMPAPWDAATETRSAWLACASVWIGNWLLRLRGEPVIPCLVSGNMGSMGHAALKHLAQSTAMNVLKLSAESRKPLTELRSRIGTYNYPTCVEPDGRGRLALWPASNTDLAFIHADPPEAAALSAGGLWYEVCAPAVRADIYQLPPAGDLFLYLADLQRREYALRDDYSIAHAVLADLCEWYERTVDVAQTGACKEAKQMLRLNSQCGDGLLDVCFWLAQQGGLELKRAVLDESKLFSAELSAERAVWIDDDQERVTVFRVPLEAALRAAKLPVPEFSGVTNDLAARKLLVGSAAMARNGWSVNKAYWDMRARQWRRTNLLDS